MRHTGPRAGLSSGPGAQDENRENPLAKQASTKVEPALPIAISATHARALSAHFKTVEEYLRVVESWLDGYEGVFYGSRAELSAPQRARIRTLITEIITGLQRTKSDLALEPLEGSSLGIIRAYLSELWVSLVETRGRYLRGYGEVPPELAAYLDRRVDELESRVNEIRRLTEEAAAAGAGKAEGEGSAPSGRGPR